MPQRRQQPLPEVKSTDASVVAQEVLKDFLWKHENPDHKDISTGLTLLDRAIIGLRPKLYVLGARPSVGKSALAQTISRNVLGQPGLGVITLSAEMADSEILERDLAFLADVNVRKIMSGRFVKTEELGRITEAAKAVPEGRWRIIDKAMPIGILRQMVAHEKEQMASKGIRLALVVLDYIQLYAEGDFREQAVSAVSRGCKLLSQELETAVLALSQLSRGLEHREDKEPTLADLRESGAIEQDADVVMFLTRKERIARLNIAKQRGGPTGSFPLSFNPETTAFSDYEPPEKASPIPNVRDREDKRVPGPGPEGNHDSAAA